MRRRADGNVTHFETFLHNHRECEIDLENLRVYPIMLEPRKQRVILRFHLTERATIRAQTQ